MVRKGREKEKKEKKKMQKAASQGGSNMRRLRALALAKLHSLTSSRIQDNTLRSVDVFPRKILALRSFQIPQHTRMKRDAIPFLSGGWQRSIMDCQVAAMDSACSQTGGSSAEQCVQVATVA
jgi:hypothetical protein